MIPRDYITEWRTEAPWVQDFQVEQDLVISRALVEIFSHSVLRTALALRCGAALYKLHLKPPARYSEDIDLVQTRAEPAGPMMDALRGVLDPWLGKPKWKQSEGRVTFIYRFDSEEPTLLPACSPTSQNRASARHSSSLVVIDATSGLPNSSMNHFSQMARSGLSIPIHAGRLLPRSCGTARERQAGVKEPPTLLCPRAACSIRE